MAVVRDAIHGNIILSGIEERVVDCADFQRLRRVRQLALAHLVYPGAMHTRFEHSLGTMHLASGICDVLGISGDEKERIRMSALLHDLGHTAFSHEGEAALSGLLGTHEEIGKGKASSGELGDIVGEAFSARELLSGKGISGEIIACDIGADRMDYLKRDAHHTGVAYGIIDTGRLIHTMEGRGGRVCVERGGLEAAESLLIGRFLMFSTVYMHKTVRIASGMLGRAIRMAVEGGLEPPTFLSCGDEEMLLRMAAVGGSAPYASALLERRFYKQALALSDRHPLLSDAGAAEAELSARCGCDVIISMPGEPANPPEFGVVGKDGVRDIKEASELVSALLAAEERRRNAIVMCPARDRGKVERAALDYFSK